MSSGVNYDYAPFCPALVLNAQGIEENDGHGYVWHTIGSGKTLTSFKASSHAAMRYTPLPTLLTGG